MKNSGLENEQDIIDLLNGKKVEELPEFWQRRMKQLCKEVEGDDQIECFKCVYNKKADVGVRVRNYRYNISIKSGYFVSVHSERLSSFTGFLKSIGISEELITTLKSYHYGDGTTDGTGDFHYDLNTIKENMQNSIDDFNKVVNKKEILRQIIMRVLCTGTPYQRSFVSHIYAGTVNYGDMIDAKTLIEYICSGYPCSTDSIHFGPFIYAPAYRGVENFNSNNVKRYYVNIKWPSMYRDIRDAKDWYFGNIGND
ncbi:MAG: hypothetical protein J5666_02960 [Bacilli bacterium]|nr:hypothetical protein [Bacilli bacterium]